MDKEIYPGEVDFNYKIRCDKHNFKPYVYCEMCMIRTQLQDYLTEARKYLQQCLSSAHLAVTVLNDITDKQSKEIAELQIKVKLLSEEKIK